MQVAFDVAIFAFALQLIFRAINNVLLKEDVGQEQRIFIKRVLIAGLVTKLVIIVSWYLIAGGHEFNMSVSDAWDYDFYGKQAADTLRHFGLPFLDQNQPLGFSLVVGVLYTFFGDYHIVVSIYNMLLTVLMAIMVFQISNKVSDSVRAATYAFTATMFYPHFISASYLLLKDITVTFLVLCAIWSLFCVRRTFAKIVVNCLSLLFLIYMRLQLAVFGALLTGITIIFDQANLLALKTKKHKVFVRLSILVLVGIFIFCAQQLKLGEERETVLERGYTLSQTSGQESEESIVGGDEYIRVTATGQGAGKLVLFCLERPTVVSTAVIVTFIRVFYGPFFLYSADGPRLNPYDPNEIGFRAVLECLAGAFTGLMMPLIAVGFCWLLKRQPRKAGIWLFPCAWILAMTFAIPLARWRLPVMPIIFVFFGIGASRLGASRVKHLYPVYFLLVVFSVAVNVSRLESFLLPIAICCGVPAALAVLLVFGRGR